MARITIEDCLGQVDNRFQLVLLASKRARQLALGGAEASIPWENDKATVVALREVASGALFLTDEGEVCAVNDPVETEDTGAENLEMPSSTSDHPIVFAEKTPLPVEPVQVFPSPMKHDSEKPADSE